MNKPYSKLKATLTVFLLIISLAPFSFQTGCLFDGKQGGDLTVFTGVENDPQATEFANPCSASAGRFRMLFLLRCDVMPAAGTTAQLFSYHNKVKVYLQETVPNKRELVVWKHDEAGDKIIHKFEISKPRKWILVWYELSRTKSEIAIREKNPWINDEDRKQTFNLSSEFQFESDPANDKFHIGKTWAVGEVSPTGLAECFRVVCNPIGYEKFKTWRFIGQIYQPELRSFYVFDNPNQFHTNYASDSKQPLVYRGDLASVEPSDPVFEEGFLKVGSNQRLTQGVVDFDFGFRKLRGSTHVAKIRILKFPARSDFGDLFTFRNDKEVKVQVSGIGGLRVVSGSKIIFLSKKITMSLNTWYWFKVVHMRTENSRYFMLSSIGLEVLGFEPEGTSYDWKKLDTIPGGNHQYLSLTIGGGSSSLEFNILQLAQFKGSSPFKQGTASQNCPNQTPASAPCKIELLYTSAPSCLECTQLTTEKWIIKPDVLLSEASCAIQSTTGFVQRPSTNPLFSNVFTQCEVFQRNSGADTCDSCHSSCAKCNAGGSTNCEACNWGLNLGPVTGTCTTCPSGKFSLFGSCQSCSASGCSSCPNDVCVTANCLPTQTLHNGAVCCESNQFFHPGTGTCKDCHSTCGTCFLANSQSCFSCAPGQALNRDTNECVTGCDSTNGKFYDPQTSSCSDCGTGCKECLNASFCTLCDTSNGFYLNEGTCLTCPVANAKFIYPTGDACHDCSTGCLQCSDGSSCSICDRSLGFYLSGGECLSCKINSGEFIPKSGDSCHSCLKGCSTCSNSSSCNSCNMNQGYVLLGSSCTLCQTSSSKFINQSHSPPTCDDCPINCQECSQAGSCTKCSPDYSLNLTGGCEEDQVTPSENHELFYLRQIPKPSYSDSDVYLELTIPSLDQNSENLSKNSIFEGNQEPENNLFEITSPSHPEAEITTFLNRSNTGKLTIAANFSILPKEIQSIEELQISIKASQRQLCLDPPITLTNQTITKTIILAPRIEEKEIEEATKNGNSMSELMKSTQQFTLFMAPILALFDQDPQGLTLKFNQYLGWTSRLAFINIKFGEKLSAFLEEMPKKFEILAKTPEDRDRVILSQNGNKGKFGAFGLEIKIKGRLLVMIIVYTTSYFIKLASFMAFAFLKGQGKGFSKWLVYFIYYQRRIHFIVYGLTFSDFVFYGLRIIFHQNWIEAKEKIITALLCLFALILTLADSIEIVLVSIWIRDNTKKFNLLVKQNRIEKLKETHSKNKNSNIDQKPQQQNSLGGTSQRKGSISSLESRSLIKKSSAEVLSPNQSKKLRTISAKQVDSKETLGHLTLNMTIVDFLSSGLSRSKPTPRSTYCVLSNYMLMIKLAVHLLCLVSLIHLPLTQILIMTIVELTDLVLSIYHFLRNKYLRSVFDLISGLLTTLFSLVFMLVCLYITLKHGSEAIYVEKLVQDMGMWIIKFGVVVEYLFAGLKTFVAGVAFLRRNLCQKNSNRGKVNPSLELAGIEIGEKVAVIEKEGPIFYKTIAMVSFVNPNNNNKKKKQEDHFNLEIKKREGSQNQRNKNQKSKLRSSKRRKFFQSLARGKFSMRNRTKKKSEIDHWLESTERKAIVEKKDHQLVLEKVEKKLKNSQTKRGRNSSGKVLGRQLGSDNKAIHNRDGKNSFLTNAQRRHKKQNKVETDSIWLGLKPGKGSVSRRKNSANTERLAKFRRRNRPVLFD